MFSITHNGITLIALVITIIVMLILVAVSISLAINGGLFSYAGRAAHDTELAKQDELKLAEGQIEVDGKIYGSFNDYINGKEYIPVYSNDLLNNGVLTKTAEYTDTNEDTAIIPAGFGIVEDCEIINLGLVISDEFDSNGNSIGNEFVWIPVPGKDMKVATISDPYTETYDFFNQCIEPKELNSNDSNTNSATGGPYTWDSQEELNWYYGENYFTYTNDFTYEAHYKEMAESVNKYGGFYIGRYETTIDSSNKVGSKYNETVLTTDKIIKTGTNPNNSESYYYRWWGLYYAGRHANVEGNGSTVQTNMIWGQELDKMIAYFDSKSLSYAEISYSTYSKPSNVLASGQATYTNKTDSTDVIKDKIYNIYDLRANAYDWTAEAISTNNSRVCRGGTHNNSFSVSKRISGMPNDYLNFSSMRLTLYIR